MRFLSHIVRMTLTDYLHEFLYANASVEEPYHFLDTETEFGVLRHSSGHAVAPGDGRRKAQQCAGTIRTSEGRIDPKV